MRKKNNSFVILICIVIVAVSAFLINKFILNRSIQLKTEKGGSINVLVLGIGGGTHDGPDLSDTIILANLNPTKKTAALISVPRDLWIQDIKGKINLAYALGQQQNKQGILLSKAVVQKVTGQNIDYTVVIDFSGFVKFIDYIGGVDVNVVHTLDDYAYPIEGKEDDTCGHTDKEIIDITASIATDSAAEINNFPCRYKHLHVEAGMQHMDGELALEFSRSRHGAGSEGTDFARSRRQQEVITAVRSKVLSIGTLLNPIKVIGIFNIIKSNINTDIQIDEFDDFINLARQMKDAKISSNVIDFGDEVSGRYGLLINPPPEKAKGFASVLEPRVGDGDFSEIHDYVACVIQGDVCTVLKNGISKNPVTK